MRKLEITNYNMILTNPEKNPEKQVGALKSEDLSNKKDELKQI